MQIPWTKAQLNAFYTLWAVFWILTPWPFFLQNCVWLVLSTILPQSTRILRLQMSDCSLFLTHFSGRVYPPSSASHGVAFWGDFRGFRRRFGRIFPLFRRLRARRLAPLSRVSSSLPPPELISFSGSAHFALNVSQTPLPLQPIQLPRAASSLQSFLAAQKTMTKHLKRFSYTQKNWL